jgi:hypothetical protein
MAARQETSGSPDGRQEADIKMGFFQSIGRAVRAAQECNTRAADLMSGNALYRHSSRRDDAAQQMERMRLEEQAALGRLVRAIEKLKSRSP